MLAFDTLKYANTLKNAGIPPAQAEAQADALADVLNESVVTKSDFYDLTKNIDQRFNELKNDLKNDISLIKKDIGHIENRLDTILTTMKWGAGLILSYLTLLMTIMQFLKS